MREKQLFSVAVSFPFSLGGGRWIGMPIPAANSNGMRKLQLPTNC